MKRGRKKIWRSIIKKRGKGLGEQKVNPYVGLGLVVDCKTSQARGYQARWQQRQYSDSTRPRLLQGLPDQKRNQHEKLTRQDKQADKHYNDQCKSIILKVKGNGSEVLMDLYSGSRLRNFLVCCLIALTLNSLRQVPKRKHPCWLKLRNCRYWSGCQREMERR